MKHRHHHIKSRLRHLRPKRSIFTLRIFWLAVLLVLLAGGVGYLYFVFPPFQVQTISILGNEKISKEDIENTARKEIKQQLLGLTYANIITMNTGALTQGILNTFAGIEKVVIKKSWLKNVQIEIAERKPVAIFCPDAGLQHCFWIDKTGVAYEPIDYVDKNYFIVRQTSPMTDFVLGQIAVDQPSMNLIIEAQDNLWRNFQIGIREVAVQNPLIITTGEDWKIYFDPAQDARMQVSRMNVMLKNEITPDIRKHLQYIYLQYKDRAYYR